MQKYFTLDECLELISGENGKRCYRLLEDNRELFEKARGSKTKHQAWEGGYLDYITETMNIAVSLYYRLDNLRALDFKVSDSLLVLFLHDLEKPFKQNYKKLGLENENGVKDENKIKEFKKQLISKYGFELTEEQENALKYCEGEGEDYDLHKRVQLPLAAFVHICDVVSARIWHDYPKEKGKW